MAAPSAQTKLEVEKNVFDLESKDYVTIRKSGDFTPVATVEEFTTRLQNDAKNILEVINAGLEEFSKKQLATNDSVKWQLVDVDDETGAETLTDFTGVPISEKKGKQLNAVVIQLAKAIYGYAKNMVPGDKEKNRAAKKEARAKALAQLLSNDATVEGLKKED